MTDMIEMRVMSSDDEADMWIVGSCPILKEVAVSSRVGRLLKQIRTERFNNVENFAESWPYTAPELTTLVSHVLTLTDLKQG